LKFDYHYVSGGSILTALAPLVNKWVDGDKQLFSIDHQDSLSIILTTENGFRYTFDSSKAVVEFKHRLKAKAVSAGPPVLEMLSHALPFTKLLPEVSRRLVEATSLVAQKKARSLQRVGVISTTIVTEDEAPPGIRRFLEYVGRPWKASLDDYNLRLIAPISQTSKWTDQCIHQMWKTEESEGLCTLIFDWQRVFPTPKSVSMESLKETIDSAADSALEYFEDLAEGNRFDVQLLSKTA